MAKGICATPAEVIRALVAMRPAQGRHLDQYREGITARPDPKVFFHCLCGSGHRLQGDLLVAWRRYTVREFEEATAAVIDEKSAAR